MKRVPPKTSRVGGGTPGRADQYAQVFVEPKKHKRTTASPPDALEDAVDYAERAISAVTRTIRETYTDGTGHWTAIGAIRDPAMRCGLCDETDEPHYHGATLYQGGKEVF